MRKRAREEITPIPAIYNEQLISLNTHPERNSIAPKLPSFTSLKSSLYRNRRSRLPPLPKTRTEIRVEGDFDWWEFPPLWWWWFQQDLDLWDSRELTEAIWARYHLCGWYLLYLSFPISPALHNQWFCWWSAVPSGIWIPPYQKSSRLQQILRHRERRDAEQWLDLATFCCDGRFQTRINTNCGVAVPIN